MAGIAKTRTSHQFAPEPHKAGVLPGTDAAANTRDIPVAETGATAADGPVEPFGVDTAAGDCEVHRLGSDAGRTTPPETLVELVEQAVSRHPDRLALDLGERTMTYHELWVAAGRVAANLAAIDPHASRVGLCASRSLLAYVGYLGILRLGAAVVPMNPSFPARRNRQIAQLAEVSVVLTDNSSSEILFRESGHRVLDEQQSLAAAPPRTNRRRMSGNDLAYVLFTSGSTGTPKGVPIEHRSALAYVKHVIDRYSVGPGCRLSQTFDLTFDPAVFDLFASWGSGATLVVPSQKELLTAPRYVAQRGITHWFSVPSAISVAQRLRQLAPDVMPALRWSIFSGEQLTTSQARVWKRAAGASIIENVYGPTELTVGCIEYRLPEQRDQWPRTSNGTIPIGSVYPHLEHMIIDSSGLPAPEGELCVRGVQRFPGYLDAANNHNAFCHFNGTLATRIAGRFVPAAEHWYCTGDRIRVEDGVMVHLGRSDRQVKLHGYRIELGEVEAALRRHDGVHECAVFVANGNGSQRLAACFVGPDVDPRQLKEFLRTILPSFMVPGILRQMTALPLNDNGKVDYRHLQAVFAAHGS